VLPTNQACKLLRWKKLQTIKYTEFDHIHPIAEDGAIPCPKTNPMICCCAVDRSFAPPPGTTA
jgi:hypothetical protein